MNTYCDRCGIQIKQVDDESIKEVAALAIATDQISGIRDNLQAGRYSSVCGDCYEQFLSSLPNQVQNTFKELTSEASKAVQS